MHYFYLFLNAFSIPWSSSVDVYFSIRLYFFILWNENIVKNSDYETTHLLLSL